MQWQLKCVEICTYSKWPRVRISIGISSKNLLDTGKPLIPLWNIKKKFELTTKTCYLVKEQEISQFVFSKWSSLCCCFYSLCSLKENFSSNGFREVAQLLIYRQKDNAERLQFLLYYFWDLVLGSSYSSLWRALLLQAISSWC